MNHRHALAGRAVQAKAVEALRALAAGAMSPVNIVWAMVEGAKLERLAHEQVTDAVRQEVESEGRVTLEVVERIVPVRGDGVDTPAADRPGDEASAFDLPD